MAELAGRALSIIVPACNAAATLERCLAAVAAQTNDDDEVIVVDDGFADGVGAIAGRFTQTVLRLAVRSGPAAARNRGAGHASRPLLMFVDADVVLHPDAIARGRAHFEDPSIDAVIGSYDDEPEARTLVSRFKNLAHHHFHQRAAGPIGSFWGACGFIKRDVFNAVGGFDEQRFARSSIEDVELGWRVSDRGGRIVLDPRILVTHLKRWTLASLMKTDTFDRAAPWVRWSLERRRLGAELNVSRTQQLALAVSILLVASAIAAPVSMTARLACGVLTATALAMNYRLFGLLWRKGGVRLLAAGFALQQLYYLCALAGLAIGALGFCWPRRRSADPPPARVGI